MDLFVSAGLSKPKRLIYKKDLQPINNLKTVFREVRDYFAGNVTGITRDEKIAQNIMRLLFCKICDEKTKNAEELVDFANRPNENSDEFAKRIHLLFSNVKTKYSDIFDLDEEIEILPADLSFIVKKMEDFYLIDANRDIIADAFEELIGTAFRGGEGQFFTPRNIVQMMIDIMNPQNGEKIIDPACGSGGFLAHILQNLLPNGNNHYIAGLDKDLFLSKLAKIYLTLLGENEYHIFCENSLEQPENWSKKTNEFIKLGTFDLILTNPPFGAKIPVIGEDLLRQFELGHIWTKQKEEWFLTKQIREKQPPQILFIERIIQLLKDGGRAGIVLPEGVFGNPSDRYIWEYIKKYASVIGVVSLSQETFQPSTHTKTSVVFLEKKFQSRKNVFLGIAKNIGHNKNGKETYKMDSNGNYIFDSNGQKIIDDETPEIAHKFNVFLSGKLKEENHLGFVVSTDEILENVYIPESYKPELKEKMQKIRNSDEYELVKFGDLVEQGIIQIKRGNEIGSQYYGTGSIPFIRTTDIVNWEIKMDTVKAISEDVYQKYKKQQDIRENDILFVNDGTFLIGRCSMVTKNDVKSVIQSHLRKIRVLNKEKVCPYYLFYLLNTKFVQEQVEVKTFTQATLSTLGNRIMELYLPFHKKQSKISELSTEIQNIIEQKIIIRERTLKITEGNL
ncbi:MAG: N-6 DNA methylase [Dysgonamonadaceae bacterium]|jgi:type I restriction enzyme M protein|nr:N-6 DNA methylase [Dysgonamonadaceae bacterium]